ncbi:MAG: hypothetical protein ABIT23_06905 [Nitrosospira sp.]
MQSNYLNQYEQAGREAEIRALKLAPQVNNTGREWKALSESMRKAIEVFNRLSKEDQPIALARMREDLRLQPKQVEKLVQQLELGRGLGG